MQATSVKQQVLDKAFNRYMRGENQNFAAQVYEVANAILHGSTMEDERLPYMVGENLTRWGGAVLGEAECLLREYETIKEEYGL